MTPPSPQPALHQQHHAYTTLTTYLNSHAHEVLEIEILPSALEPQDSFFLQDGPNLGLPKKTLTLAFLEARRLFFTHKHAASPHDRSISLEATRVMLLFDPEYVTAANYRKRAILSAKEDENTSTSALEAEFRFLDSILTSPLHRQSKSPTLWAHRAWLLTHFLPLIASSEIPAFVAAELQAVCKAGERHPKNYYAWQYARRLLCKTASESSRAVKHDSEHLASTCVQSIQTWCCVHPSDISSWTFLAWLLKRAGPEGTGHFVRHVVSYAMSVRLANESLWVFVRTVGVDGTLSDDDANDIMRLLCKHSVGVEGTDQILPADERVTQVLEWMRECRQLRPGVKKAAREPE